ncbi:MAG TPA: hypothetical protein VGB72_08865 [Acidobacteriota bacterium]
MRNRHRRMYELTGLPGWMRFWYSPAIPWGAAELTPEQELDFLKAEAQQLQDELRPVEQRIQELEREQK